MLERRDVLFEEGKTLEKSQEQILEIYFYGLAENIEIQEAVEEKFEEKGERVVTGWI